MFRDEETCLGVPGKNYNHYSITILGCSESVCHCQTVEGLV